MRTSKPPYRPRPDAVQLWTARIASGKYTRFAEAGSTLKPDKVDVEAIGGYFLCLRSTEDTWSYAFENQTVRDRFVNKYRPHGAKPSKDPWPAKEKV